MALGLAGVLLAVFVVNVTYGAITGDPVLGNVSEMLLLLAAAISFVAGVLRREAQEKAGNEASHKE